MSRIPVQRAGRLSIISAVRVAVATVVLGAAAHASAATLWVNDDAASYAPPGTSCLEAGYATIQDAVDAASPGDTIDVCDGIYAENIVILTADLTVASISGAAATVIAPTTSAHVVEVRATGLTLEGFTIVAAGFDDADIGINVAIEGDTGATLLRNIIRGGRIGINLGCVSAGTTIHHTRLISQTEAGINIDTCEAPPFPGSHDNSIHHNVACSLTSTASIALGGVVERQQHPSQRRHHDLVVRHGKRDSSQHHQAGHRRQQRRRQLAAPQYNRSERVLLIRERFPASARGPARLQPRQARRLPPGSLTRPDGAAARRAAPSARRCRLRTRRDP